MFIYYPTLMQGGAFALPTQIGPGLLQSVQAASVKGELCP